MAGEALLFVLFAAFAIGAPLVLYVLVRDEQSRRTVESTDWENAERAARKDTREGRDDRRRTE